MRANNGTPVGHAGIASSRHVRTAGQEASREGAGSQERASGALGAETFGPLQMPTCDAPSGGMGLILADLSLKPIYTNASAVGILTYPDEPRAAGSAVAVQERLRSILATEHLAFGPALPARSFLSGRRRYLCRSVLMDGWPGGTRQPVVAILLERPPRALATLPDVGQRFHLSPREVQTVEYLLQGLTTKEIARCMGVSPNTIKQFIRLIMGKMGVTTRSGIVGKLVA